MGSLVRIQHRPPEITRSEAMFSDLFLCLHQGLGVFAPNLHQIRPPACTKSRIGERQAKERDAYNWHWAHGASKLPRLIDLMAQRFFTKILMNTSSKDDVPVIRLRQACLIGMTSQSSQADPLTDRFVICLGAQHTICQRRVDPSNGWAPWHDGLVIPRGRFETVNFLPSRPMT